MTVPEMPWYRAMEEMFQPLDPYTRLLLVGLGAITLYVAWKGDTVVRMGWLVYLVSP